MIKFLTGSTKTGVIHLLVIRGVKYRITYEKITPHAHSVDEGKFIICEIEADCMPQAFTTALELAGENKKVKNVEGLSV